LLRDVFTVADAATLSAGGNSHLALGGLPRPVFLFVGQLIERKGARYLLQASSLLVRRGLSGFSVVFVGEGAQAKDLHDLAKSLGLDGVVRFVGPIRYDYLGAYFSACDVFVFPTLEDIWGMVALEAMACGKPVLCSKYAGSKEMVQDGVNGFIFDPHNPHELAHWMERFAREPGLIPEFVAQSRAIIAKYTPERAAEILGSVIRNILDSKEVACN